MAELIENSLKTVFGRLIRERSMNDINVTMLCRETGISRRAFYNHYNSMADLCRQTIFCDLASTLQDNTGYDQWVDGFRSILYYGRANRKMFFHIFFSDYRSSLMTALDEYSHNIIRKAIRRCADDSRISVSSETINFMSDFYCYVFIGVIRQDISTRFSSDPEEILAGCQIMMESSIQKSLMKFADAGK